MLVFLALILAQAPTPNEHPEFQRAWREHVDPALNAWWACAETNARSWMRGPDAASAVARAAVFHCYDEQLATEAALRILRHATGGRPDLEGVDDARNNLIEGMTTEVVRWRAEAATPAPAPR